MKKVQQQPKKSFIFILQSDTGELFAGRQIDVDNAIKTSEQYNEELDFEVIGKIAEPAAHVPLPLDFNENLIQWYKDEDKNPAFIKRAVLAITNFIK